MALTVLQKPTSFQAAQSPILFTVSESGAFVTASNFQYTAQLYIYGPIAVDSGSASSYAVRKYPNKAKVGIFDFSKWLSTYNPYTASNSSEIATYPGRNHYYVDFGWQYESGSTYVTSSLTRVTASSQNNLLSVYDGYNIWNETVNNTSPSFLNPLYYNTQSATFATDMWQVTQSFLRTDAFGCIDWWVNKMDSAFYPNTLVTTSSFEDGTSLTKVGFIASAGYTGSSTGLFNSSFEIAPNATSIGGYSLFEDNFYTASLSGSPLKTYNAKFISSSAAYSAVGTQIGPTFNMEVVCEQYYTPVRIAWKNRYGLTDYMNFYKRSDQTFTTEERLYQPELLGWNRSQFVIDNYETNQQRYIVDANQTLIVNSGWIEEGYNNILKQLLVSDTIDWIYDQTQILTSPGGNPYTGSVVLDAQNSLPLTMKTSNLEFKTHTNNKLIQYTLEFFIGQPYKFIF
jgi:hypothetical protein